MQGHQGDKDAVVVGLGSDKSISLKLYVYKISPHRTAPHLLTSPTAPTAPTAPHRTAPHRTAPHRTAPHLTSPHLTSPHLTSPHLTSPHLTSPHLTSPHHTLTLQFHRPSGLIFSVSRQNVLVPRITIGDVATFSYENFAKKSEFVNPTIFRIRTDVTWPEVVYNSRESQTWSKVKERERRSARRFWTEKAMRGVLEESANKKQMDPLLPDTWFHISPADVEQVEVFRVRGKRGRREE